VTASSPLFAEPARFEITAKRSLQKSKTELRVHSKDVACLQNKFVPSFVRRSRKVWTSELWLSFWSL
jgi:hypothetical protein